ncbi:MAG: nitrous oxide-stimulated promoter family protein [Muribaculaceae bacterium]|nr:nitrous oxide-stimulated promoter family protein [Bacteroidales bacterium]MBR5240435.1 nitrous oxide-stimulated promoter family protein [Muribaculaceae bacterium]MBR5532747.1 nitrous oxide-stimulated promoter family protein [Bacteroidales bacterium]
MTEIDKEKRIVEKMIKLYCQRKEGNRVLCNRCLELKNYAFARLDKCPFGNKKGSCKICKVHCYKPEMREHIREVMRYAGPRMILLHPIDAISHLIKKKR